MNGLGGSGGLFRQGHPPKCVETPLTIALNTEQSPPVLAGLHRKAICKPSCQRTATNMVTDNWRGSGARSRV